MGSNEYLIIFTIPYLLLFIFAVIQTFKIKDKNIFIIIYWFLPFLINFVILMGFFTIGKNDFSLFIVENNEVVIYIIILVQASVIIGQLFIIKTHILKILIPLLLHLPYSLYLTVLFIAKFIEW